MIKYLLSVGTTQDVEQDDWTPLTIAVYNGHVDVLKSLLEAGADANTTRGNGATMLLVATERGHLDIVKYLLEAGAAHS